MKGMVVKTEFGWEPAFWDEHFKEWVVEPGFAKPTRREAQADMDKDRQYCAELDHASRIYQAGIDYACGYHD